MKEIVYSVKVKDTEEAVRSVKEVDKALTDVNKQTEKNTEANKRASKSLGDVAAASGLFSKELTLVTRIQNTYNAGMSLFATSTATAGTSVTTLTRGLQILRVALVATGIGAIAVAVGTLASAFLSTQTGIDAVNRTLTPLKTGLDAVWGVIQNIALNFREVIQNIAQGFQRAANIALQVAKGNFRQAFRESKALIDDTINSAREFGTTISDAFREGAEAGRELVDVQIQLRDRQIEMIVPLARMNREYQELRTLAGDSSLSEEERLGYLRQALEIQRQIADEEKAQLDMEIRILQIQQAQSENTAEDNRRMQELIARREELDAQLNRSNRNLLRMEGQLEQRIEQRTQREEEEAAKKEEREALEREKRLLQEQQDSEDRLLREREIDNRLRELRATDFEEEQLVEMERAEIRRDMRLLEIEREIQDEELKLQEIALVNAEYQNELSDIEEANVQRRITLAQKEAEAKVKLQETISQALLSTGALIGEHTAFGKIAGVASATIDTFVGANKALAQGGILGIASAASVITAGLANVRKIANTEVPSFTGGTTATPVVNTAAPTFSQVEAGGIQSVETIFSDGDRELVGRRSKVYVTETDITETQNRVQVIENNSTF